jgi:hypothetical protein
MGPGSRRLKTQLEFGRLFRLPARRMPREENGRPGIPPGDPTDDGIALDQAPMRSRIEADAQADELQRQLVDHGVESCGGVEREPDVCADGEIVWPHLSIITRQAHAGKQRGKTIVRAFGDRFKAQHRPIRCPDLIGVDLGKGNLSKPEALNEFCDTAMEK